MAKLIKPAKVRSLVLGDSLAENNGFSAQDLTGWPALVASDLQSKYPGTLEWQFKTWANASVKDVLKDVTAADSEIDLILLSWDEVIQEK